MHSHAAESRLGLLNLDVLGLEDDFAAAGHGIPGVDREVHENLLELARIGQNRAELGLEAGSEFYVLADEAPEHLLGGGHQLVENEHPRLEDLFAAESQELAGQGSRPARRV